MAFFFLLFCVAFMAVCCLCLVVDDSQKKEGDRSCRDFLLFFLCFRCARQKGGITTGAGQADDGWMLLRLQESQMCLLALK